MNKVAMVVEMEVTHESEIHQANLPMATAECPVFEKQIAIWHHSMGVMGPLSGGRLTTLDHFHHGRGRQHFAFT